ncbi:MAG: hypothetical protein IJT53_02600 [Prevotella sp.]|nr:hypothetical protein [Prevotella sp.]
MIERNDKRGYLCALGLLLMLLTACASHDDTDYEAPVQTVEAQLNFSLPKRIAGTRNGAAGHTDTKTGTRNGAAGPDTKTGTVTRMSSEVVQADGEDDEFRGLADVHLLCFNQYPTATSSQLGNMIDINTSDEEDNETVTEEDYSLCQEISIPIGTSHFAFYARAADTPQTHEERMRYGTTEAVGLDRSTYSGNGGIRFRPVQICTSADALGGSSAGHALLALLNDLMSTTADAAAPNDRLSTANNLYINEAWQKMQALTTLSSYNVQRMVGYINKLVNQEGPDEQGKELAEAVTAKIAGWCTETPDPASDQVTLKEEYQGFPADIHLPAGAARIRWNGDRQCFEVPDKQEYGNDLNVTSVNDYVYPMNLQYQVFSDILASEELVITTPEATTGGTTPDDGTSSTDTPYKNWQELIEEGYADAGKTVRATTHSVAMVQQVQYAVGRLALRSRIGTEGNILDAHGKVVNVSNGMLTLKGYVVGSQREVDYNFQPVMTSTPFAIYDTDMNNGPQDLRQHFFSEPDYILGLGTAADATILIALELVNNGPAFQGADGQIVTGATFYLVANMTPHDGRNYSESLNQIFCKDHYTTVYITINSLANATYGLPNLEIPRPTVGMSIDLNWEEGLWYPEIPL